jgi:membrane protease YdiL (CAAX protease family)
MRSRLAAIAEIVLVTVAFNLIAGVVLRALVPAEFRALADDYEQPSLYPGALAEALRLFVRFGIGIVLAFSLLWWRRRVSPAEAGVTRAGRSWGSLILTGVAVWAFATLPFDLLYLVNGLRPLGEGFTFFDTVAPLWSRPDFWAMWAASALLLPPLFEETLFRGYARTRLAESYGPMGAVIISSFLFMLMHGHFYSTDPLKPLTLAVNIFAVLCWAYAAHRTGSIVPGVVAHALGNMPWPRTMEVIGSLLVLQLVILAVARGPVREWLSAFAREWRGRDRGATAFGVLLSTAFLVPVMSLMAAGQRRTMILAGVAWLVVFATAWVLDLLGDRRVRTGPT